MKYETIVSVDETTKQFMSYINEDICAAITDGINEALRKTNNDLIDISENINNILVSLMCITRTAENNHTTVEQAQRKYIQDIIDKFSMIQLQNKELFDEIKSTVLEEQKKVLDETATLSIKYNKNSDETINIITTEQKKVLHEVTEIDNALKNRSEEIFGRLRSFEEKLNIVNSSLEGQVQLLERLEKIEEKIEKKITYLSLPFYKRWFGKGIIK